MPGGRRDAAFARRPALASCRIEVAHPARFERVASTFGGWCSIQLNYGCIDIQTVSEIEQGQSRIQQSNPLEHSGLRRLIERFDEREGKFKMKMDSFQREANSQGAADQLLGANAPPSDHDDRPCSRARGSVRCAWGRHA